MPAQAVFIPFYKDGAFHWLKVAGVYDTGQKVPEGEPCIKSSATAETPAQRLQPDPTP